MFAQLFFYSFPLDNLGIGLWVENFCISKLRRISDSLYIEVAWRSQRKQGEGDCVRFERQEMTDNAGEMHCSREYGVEEDNDRIAKKEVQRLAHKGMVWYDLEAGAEAQHHLRTFSSRVLT